MLLRVIRVRFGARWYLIALLLPVVFVFLALAVNLAAGAPAPATEAWAKSYK